ncbi:MAG TPA: hypothetical protein VGQ39_17565 [Pyrinomonadaceae bacterium]|jgi:hypothetical protein|nr:hypothetical protein [Pyrinomonadaceae bacterium]
MIKTILIILLCTISVAAQKLETPKLTPTPSTENQRRLIKEGTALHDRGDYDADSCFSAIISAGYISNYHTVGKLFFTPLGVACL